MNTKTRTPRSKPILGWCAVGTTIALWLLSVVFSPSAGLVGRDFEVVAFVFSLVVYPVGGVLALVSFTRRERVGPAVAALLLLLVVPLLFLMFGMLAVAVTGITG